MTDVFRLPDLGEGLTDAEIVSWLVEVGDHVELNQNLAEVETAKAVVELPSPARGTVAHLHAVEGETVAVGAPLVSFSTEGEKTQGEEEKIGEHAAGVEPDAEPETVPTLVGYGAAPAGEGRPARRRRREADPSASSEPDRGGVDQSSARSERPRSSPPVRAYARAQGVDIDAIAARIGDRPVTRADVDRVHAQQTQEETASFSAAAPRRETRVPIRGVRKRTADAMVRSAFTAPHATVFQTADVSETVALLSEQSAGSDGGPRTGMLGAVARALCLVLPGFPGLNAGWDDERGDIVYRHYIDLGIAVATDRGLLLPVIRDADRRSALELTENIQDAARRAREGTTAPEELSGGTFTISNVGVFGVDAGTPILPPGQSGILALGAVRRRPWEHHGQVVLRELTTLSLSFDHRIVDGAEGAGFLVQLAALLERPGLALLHPRGAAGMQMSAESGQGGPDDDHAA